MSFTFGFYNSLNHDRLYDAVQVSEIFDGLIQDGVYSTIGEHFVVKTSENNNMVVVGSGRAWFNHTWNKNDADLPINAPEPDLLLYRYDALVFDINSNVSSRTNSIMWVQGTPSLNSPQKPEMINEVDHHQYPLCYIYRRPNINLIDAADIENMIGTDECPFVTGILQQVSISDLLSQWTAQWLNFMSTYEISANEWMNNWETDITQWTTIQKDAFASWMADEQIKFDDWFENLSYILDDDVAGHLQNEIEDLQERSNGSIFNIHTEELSLIGKSVTLTTSTETKTATFDRNGNAVIQSVTDIGDFTITASDGSRTATKQLTIPYFGSYSVELAFWLATVNIVGSESAAGQTVTIKDSKNVVAGTVVLNGTGNGTFNARYADTYMLSYEYEGKTISESIKVSDETTYSINISPWIAVIYMDAWDEISGYIITIKDPNDSVVSRLTLDSNASGTFRAHESGTYTFSYEYDENKIERTLEVTEETDYTVNINPYVKLAFHYSENDSNPASVTYPEGFDNSDWNEPFKMDLSTGIPIYGSWDPDGENAKKLKWFYPKSCMLKYNCEVDYYLDEYDETKRENGKPSNVNSTAYDGNAMVEWGQDGKKIWWKIVPDEDEKGFTFCVANDQVDDTYHAWNHYDANGNLTDHFYTPKYFGSNISGRLRSISGQANFVSNNRNTEVAYARANNTTETIEWDTEVYADWLLITLLCVLMARNMNLQISFGRGRADTNSAIGQGTMNGKGPFYGKGAVNEGVKVFGMENPWGNLWRAIRGLLFVSNVLKVKLTHSDVDGSEADDYNFDGSGYISAGGITGTNGGYISHMHINEKYLLAATVSGSETTYYTDGQWFANGTMYARVGGDWNGAGRVGGFSCNLDYAASDTGAAHGASISCKPVAV